MGVKIKDIVLRKEIEHSDLEGSVIAVDAPNLIMQVLNFSYIRKGPFESNYMLDQTRRPISHLYGLLYRVSFFYMKKMLPIFCFDGRVHPYKRKITRDELRNFLHHKKLYEDAIEKKEFDKAQSIATGRDFMWVNTIQESKKLLSYMGVPIIESPSSAESQCAKLVKDKVADLAVTQDFDCMLFGCPRQVQNLSKTSSRKVQGTSKYVKIKPVMIDLSENLKKLGIDLFQLIDAAILIGTDYCKGVSKIGSKTALTLIKKHGNIENIISTNKQKFDFSHLYNKRIMEVRKIFLFPEVLSKYPYFKWTLPNVDKIVDFLSHDHHLNSKRVEENSGKLKSRYSRCINYFNKSFSNKIRQFEITSFA